MKKERPKGPQGHWLLGMAVRFQKDPLEFVTGISQEFPKIAAFKFGPRNMYMVSDPDYIKHIMQTNNKNYRKGTKYQELKHFLGEGLLTSEGDFWRKQRRLAQPSFKREKVEGFAQTMIDDTYEMLEEWKKKHKGKSFDLLNEMMALTLRIIGKTMLSEDFKGDAKEIGEALTFMIEKSNERIQRAFNWPMWLPLPDHIRFRKYKKMIDAKIYQLIEERRNTGNSKNDLLDMLLNTKDEDTGESMNDEQLRDELATIFIAGHETTAIALTWSMYLISTHPEIEKKLKKAIQEVTKGEKVTVDMVPQFNYTLQIAEEAMRLYPPAWIMARKALGDDEIEGHHIFKGDDLLISPFQMHRSPKFWEEPEKFDPERFTPEKKKEYHKFLYFPFGGGPRLCIGNYFALMELQIILSTVYNEMSLTLKEGFKPEMYPLVTLRPDKMMMEMK